MLRYDVPSSAAWEATEFMTANGLPRVLLVDDSDLMLERAAGHLKHAFSICGSVKDGRSALAAVEALRPDVVVLDVSMPGMSGFDVAAELRRTGCTVPIVFLTIHSDEEFVRAAEEAGGLGYVVKPRIALDLATAVSEAHAGRRYVSQLG